MTVSQKNIQSNLHNGCSLSVREGQHAYQRLHFAILPGFDLPRPLQFGRCGKHPLFCADRVFRAVRTVRGQGIYDAKGGEEGQVI